MKLTWTQSAWHDYLDWQEDNKNILKKINALIEDILRNGIYGIGKPEPLKDDLSGLWSRRINDEHRLVYRVTNDDVLIFSCSGHYEK